jgi:hypothetical protein
LKLIQCLFVAFTFFGQCSAQLPDFYKTVSRVTWVVQNIDKVRPAWEALGLSDVRQFSNIQLVGQFRGSPVTIYGWQITGRLGNLTVDMIQPAEGQANAYTNFLAQHGDGILSIVHEVPSLQALQREIARMNGRGVGILQRVTLRDRVDTYFDTEQDGKFVLGLVFKPAGTPTSSGPDPVSQFGFVVWDSAAVSAYWERLGFPAFPMRHAGGDPLSLAFEAGFQRHTQFRYEWISPPPSPPNIYADFLNKHHREGVQHIGIEVDNLANRIEVYRKLGYRVRQSGAWGEAGKPGSGTYALMDTDSTGGMAVELLHRY